MRIFPQIASFANKRPFLKVTSTTFRFREVGQLVVYQVLPDLNIWEDFGQMSVL